MKPPIPSSAKAQSESPRVFKHPLLDRLSRSHISVPLIIFYGSAAGLIAYSLLSTQLAGLTITLAFWVGLFFFTLVEYLTHRYVYHLVDDTPFKKRFKYLAHGVHHDFPRDKSRLVMPPVLSSVVSFLLVVLFHWIMGSFGFSFAAGFLSGYASYLCMHYATHAFKPPKGKFRVLWRNHAIHHYQDDTVAFGVTSPFWDWVFGTLPPAKTSAS